MLPPPHLQEALLRLPAPAAIGIFRSKIPLWLMVYRVLSPPTSQGRARMAGLTFLAKVCIRLGSIRQNTSRVINSPLKRTICTAVCIYILAAFSPPEKFTTTLEVNALAQNGLLQLPVRGLHPWKLQRKLGIPSLFLSPFHPFPAPKTLCNPRRKKRNEPIDWLVKGNYRWGV